MMADISLPSTPAQISVVDQHWTFQTWWTSKLSQRRADWLTGAREWRVRRWTEVEGGVRTCWGSGGWGGTEDWAQSSGCPDWVSALCSIGVTFPVCSTQGGRERERVIAATATLQTLQRNTQPSGRLILNYRLTSILLLVSSLLILTLESRHSWYSR